MPDNIFRKALDDYCDIGGGDFMLEVIVGDPALDPKFIRRIEEVRSRNEIDSIETISNIIALNAKRINRLIYSGLSSLRISLAPLQEDLYQKIFRNNSYKKVIRNLMLLLDRNEKAGCPISVILCFRSNLTMKETLSLPDYRSIAACGTHTVEFNADFDSWTGLIAKQDLLPGMNLRPGFKLDKEPCIWLYDGPIVFSDGNVGLCGCRDINADSELVVGNILNKSLIDIWESEKVEQLRESFYTTKPPEICNRCTSYANLNLFRTKLGTHRAILTKKRIMNSQLSKRRTM